jgi:hypothetical protein
MSPWDISTLLLFSSPETSVRIIDNRVFILGLDELYRRAMKHFESKTLLPAVRTVAKSLEIRPANAPIEGYYSETPALREYFLWMRSLQRVDEAAEPRVKNLPEYQLLWDVTSSRLYGRPVRNGMLIPAGRDPLSQALIDTRPEWNIARLVKAAYDSALRDDDISLVGLAARVQDAVVLAATRESTVIYAEVATFGIDSAPEFGFEWHVDAALSDAANRFIDIFHHFVPGALPKAEPANAEQYFNAYSKNDIIGRCVRIGKSPDEQQHYHWAIPATAHPGGEFDLGVDEFWSEHIWTTKEYRQVQQSPFDMRYFQKSGIPEPPGFYS